MKKSNPNRLRYSRIATLEELRYERAKVRWQTRMAEEGLVREYARLRDMCTFPNLLGMAFERLDNIRSVVSGVRDGYHAISSLFHRKHKDDAEK